MLLTDRMRVSVPEGEFEGMAIRRFVVTGREIASIRYSLQGRGCNPGEYTMLREGDKIWMSDTTAERIDHLDPLFAIQRLKAERILINGLGLGMVVAAALTFDHVQSIDIIEKDERVLRLVARHYEKDRRVHIHHADAFAMAKSWPAGTRWGVAWHDIWPTFCSDNLSEMERLHRSYGQRVDWQGSWGREWCLMLREQERELEWG